MMPNSGGAVSDDASSGSGSNNSNGGHGGSVLKKGPWTAAEDAILIEYVRKHGEGNWNAVQKNSGLSRCGKSCRLRWANHLRPNLKKGSFSPEEERLILELHAKLGNKWARMAAQLPGRTDNEIKNYWNTRVKRRQRAGLPLYPQDIQKQASTFHLHHQTRPSSQSGGSSMTLSSQQTKPNFISPLSQFDPMSFSTATPLLSQHNTSPFLNTGIHGFKRFRGNGVGFSQQLSLQTPALPSSSSLYNTHNYTSQLLPSQNFSSQFSMNNYDYNPQSTLHNNFSGSGLINPGSTFSVKPSPELPSNQISLPVANNLGSPQNANDSKVAPSYRDNSGLLDALLQEAEAMGGRGQSKQEQTQDEKCSALEDFLNNGPSSGPVFSDNAATPPLGSGNQWEDASSAHSSPGEDMKKTPKLDINTSVEDDDLSSLLNSIPTTMMVSDFYHEGNETSNGQSSSVTDEDLGLDMQQLPSSTNAATASAIDDWSLGAWNNLPGMSC